MADALHKRKVSFQVIDPFPIEGDLPLLFTYRTISQANLFKHSRDFNLHLLKNMVIRTLRLPRDKEVKVRIDRALGVISWLDFIDYIFYKLPASERPRLNVRVKRIKRHRGYWEVITSYRNYKVKYLVIAIDFFPTGNLSKAYKLLQRMGLAEAIKYDSYGTLRISQGRFEPLSANGKRELRNLIDFTVYGKLHGYSFTSFFEDKFVHFFFSIEGELSWDWKWLALEEIQRRWNVRLLVEDETENIVLPFSIISPFVEFSRSRSGNYVISKIPEDLLLIGDVVGSSNPVFLYNTGTNMEIVSLYADLIAKRITGARLKEEITAIYREKKAWHSDTT